MGPTGAAAAPTGGAAGGPQDGLELGPPDAGAHPAAAQVRTKARAHAHAPARLAMPVRKTSRPLPSGNSAFGTPHRTAPHHVRLHHTTLGAGLTSVPRHQ